MRKRAKRRSTTFADIHRGAVGRARVESVKALTYDSGDGDLTLISGVARFLDIMWQKDQDAGMVAEDAGENDWSLASCPPLVATRE